MFQLLFIKMSKSNGALALSSILNSYLLINYSTYSFKVFFSVFQVNMKYNLEYIKKTYEEIYIYKPLFVMHCTSYLEALNLCRFKMQE